MLSVKLRRDCFVVPPRKDGSIERHCEERSNLKLLKYIFNLIIVYIGLFYSINFALSQNKVSQLDSLKTVIKNIHKPEEICNLYNILALKYEESNLDSALLYSKKALNIAKKFTNRKLFADTYYSLGVTYKNKNITDSANLYLINSLKIYEEQNDFENIIKTNVAIGEYYRGTHILRQAAPFEKMAITLSIKKNIFTYLPSAYNRLGAIYFELSANIANNSFYTDTLLLSISYIDSSIYWSDKLKTNQCNISNNNILGACYQNLKKFDKANIYLNKALTDAKKNGEFIEIPMIYRNLSLNYFNTKQYKKAIEMALSGVKIADSLGLNIWLRLNYHALFQIYFENKDFEKSMFYLFKADSLQPIIYNTNAAAKVKEFEAKYRNKENELLIEQQNKEIVKKKNQFVNIIIGFAFTVLILIIGLFFTVRIRRINKLLENKNKEILKLNQFKDDLTGMIVHDLKNPLNTIISISKNLNKNEQNNFAIIKEENETIESTAFNMLNIVNNIIDIQKIEETNINLVYSENAILNTIDSALMHINLLQSQKNISVQKNINGNYLAKYDNDLIERVLINLLTNALKFSHNNGIITIDGEIINNFIKIKISDNGPGIPSDKISILFNKFVRAEIREIGLSSSSGLGLAFSKLVINAHGGEIGVISEFGKGSCFWFTIIPMSDYCVEIKKNDNSINIPVGFSSRFLQEISPLKKILLEYKFYQTSKIIYAVDNFKCENVEFNKWKSQVKNAVLNSNVEKYNELINY